MVQLAGNPLKRFMCLGVECNLRKLTKNCVRNRWSRDSVFESYRGFWYEICNVKIHLVVWHKTRMYFILQFLRTRFKLPTLIYISSNMSWPESNHGSMAMTLKQIIVFPIEVAWFSESEQYKSHIDSIFLMWSVVFHEYTTSEQTIITSTTLFFTEGELQYEQQPQLWANSVWQLHHNNEPVLLINSCVKLFFLKHRIFLIHSDALDLLQLGFGSSQI